jgi:hypothetical protein
MDPYKAMGLSWASGCKPAPRFGRGCFTSWFLYRLRKKNPPVSGQVVCQVAIISQPFYNRQPPSVNHQPPLVQYQPPPVISLIAIGDGPTAVGYHIIV